MTVQFPAIQPTEDGFVAPEWPVTSTRSQSGVRSVRLWGNKPSDAGMTLTFANKTQSQAGLIYQAHHDANGIVDDLTFPAIVWKNLTDPNLLAYLARNNTLGLQWYWAGVPQGERVSGGSRVTVRCEFRAELRL
jgi:hypothetical protein